MRLSLKFRGHFVSLKYLSVFAIVLLFNFNTSALGDEDHGTAGQGPLGSHPAADSLIPLINESVTQLKAEDVLTGAWKLDENGACDSQKGCPYRNGRGETAYLPLNEKKRLEQLMAADSNKSAARPQVAQNNKIEEVSSEAEWNRAFEKSANKDVIVLLFGAENCGPCHALQSQIKNRRDPNLGVFLAERPDYASLSGNPLHTKFRSSIGNGVPVAFIYTKDENGNWKGVVVKQSARTPIMGAIDSALTSKRRVQENSSNPPRQAAQAPQDSAPNNNGMVTLEFSKKPGGGLMIQESSQGEPEQVFLLERGVNDRVAAFKNSDGTFRLAPSHVQQGLKKFYQEQASKVAALPEEKRKFVGQFLDSFSHANSEVAQVGPNPPAQTSPNSQAGNLPRPGSSGGRKPSTSAPGLFPANTNGNPGFPFALAFRDGSFANCQATLISASGGLCMAATAGHCLQFAVKGSSQASCPLTGRNFQYRNGSAVIEMADFGRVSVNIYVNPFHTKGPEDQDSGVFTWPCDGPGQVRTVSLSNAKLKDGEAVLYGKVMNGKEGLYRGVVNGTRALGEIESTILQPFQRKIEVGDSGGGAYRQTPDGQLELVGVLSSKNGGVGSKDPLGHYASNRSLDFIKCVKGSLERPAFAQK